MERRPDLVRVAVLATVALVAPLGANMAYAAPTPGVTIHGVVLKPGGVPLAGATVTMTPQRPNTISEYVKVGETYWEDPVVTVTTQVNGTFALHLPSVDQRLADFAEENGGILNFWVHALHSVHVPPPRTVETPTPTPTSPVTPAVTVYPPVVPEGLDIPPTPSVSAGPVVPDEWTAPPTPPAPTNPPSMLPPTPSAAPTTVPTTLPTPSLAPPTLPPTPETPPNGTIYSAVDIVYLAVDSTGAVEKVTGDAGEPLGMADVVTLETEATSNADMLSSGPTTMTDGCNPNPRPRTTIVAREAAFEPFGQVHTGVDTTISVDYGEHANTDLGGAIKPQGKGWKGTAGYSHMGNKSSMITAQFGENEGWSVLTVFKYVKERIDFIDQYTHDPCYTEERIRAEGWRGDSVRLGKHRYSESTWEGLQQADRNQVLGEFPPGAKWTKKSGRGRKMTVEVEAFHVGLTAQSTWSAQIDVFYTFGHALRDRPHWIYHPTKELSAAPAIYAW